MAIYEFELTLAGDVDGALDALYEAGWADATVSTNRDGSGGSALFAREADSAVEAVASAIIQAESCGLEVVSVGEDLVTTQDIADRIERTTQAVDHWVAGRRGPGGFPAPRIVRGRGSLYSWAEVAAWLTRNRILDLSEVDVRIAEACAVIDAALEVRRRSRDLTEGERRQVAALVA